MSVNTLQETPNALRTHIALFGRRNSGKSSLINALAGQPLAIVSAVAGTTADPVSKAMEIYPLGPCVFIDTAGFDDAGELGKLRVKKTAEVLERCDIAILVLNAGQEDTTQESDWFERLKERSIPTVVAVNKSDISTKIPLFAKERPYALVSARQGLGINTLKQRLIEAAPRGFEAESICGHLVSRGDRVLLVAPQDLQAPKGRLILPQVQTLRDLLDLGAIASMVTLQNLPAALAMLKAPPELIITDSQVFAPVKKLCPKQTRLTSFSVLMARYKGDIEEYLRGVQQVDSLVEGDKVLILEACSHDPLDGDIGREKIPAALRKRVGQGLLVEVRCGSDIPANLSSYALAVHCGGCMFTRTQLLSRIARCKAAGLAITNYGILLAKLQGILDDIAL